MLRGAAGGCPAGSLYDVGDVLAQLRHGGGHLLGEDVTEGAKGVELAAHELVAAADELDKLSRVDVRVTAVLDVLEQLRRNRREVVGRRGGRVEDLEGAGEGFARARSVSGVQTITGSVMAGTYISLVSTSLLERPMESYVETWTMTW